MSIFVSNLQLNGRDFNLVGWPAAQDRTPVLYHHSIYNKTHYKALIRIYAANCQVSLVILCKWRKWCSLRTYRAAGRWQSADGVWYSRPWLNDRLLIALQWYADSWQRSRQFSAFSVFSKSSVQLSNHRSLLPPLKPALARWSDSL